ncbi:hypothetical protein HanIR_Chr04g0186521 [Helianthus annuus]|nr:hypothetical protein HanIR_Chr04g0186521 [Helianthus annuus]
MSTVPIRYLKYRYRKTRKSGIGIEYTSSVPVPVPILTGVLPVNTGTVQVPKNGENGNRYQIYPVPNAHP